MQACAVAHSLLQCKPRGYTCSLANTRAGRPMMSRILYSRRRARHPRNARVLARFLCIALFICNVAHSQQARTGAGLAACLPQVQVYVLDQSIACTPCALYPQAVRSLSVSVPLPRTVQGTRLPHLRTRVCVCVLERVCSMMTVCPHSPRTAASFRWSMRKRQSRQAAPRLASCARMASS